MALNPWHDLPVGDNPPKIVNVVIEVPKGSRTKYEINKKTGKIEVDKKLPMKWPINYGFIPRTYDNDNDPLDSVLLGNKKKKGQVVKARPIALFRYIDRSKRDDKIICVSLRSKKTKISISTIKKIKKFLKDYKKYLRQKSKVTGVYGKTAAEKEIRYCMKVYKKKYL